MTILDRANAFIGHEQEVDEGYETTMRRNAFIAGFKEALELVKRMREAQKEERKWGIVNFKTEEDKVACSEATKRMYQLESEVDELIKEMEV